jgi:hypothetical protein
VRLAAALVPYRQPRRARRGETAAPAGFTDDTFDFDGAAHAGSIGASPVSAVNYHLCKGIVAAVYGDEGALVRHGSAVVPLLAAIPATYGNAAGRLIGVLGAAVRDGVTAG